MLTFEESHVFDHPPFRLTHAALIILLVLTGCAPSASVEPTPRPPLLEPLGAPPIVSSVPSPLDRPNCTQRRALDGVDVMTALDLAVAELDRVVHQPDRPVDDDCAATRRPLCAALFLLGATDPIVGFARGVDPIELALLIDLHQRVLDHALTLAGRTDHEGFEAAMVRFAALDTAGALELGDDAVAEVVIARAAPGIVGPIAEIEATCRQLTPPR